MFSVTLSLAPSPKITKSIQISTPPGVTRHFPSRSPDFPLQLSSSHPTSQKQGILTYRAEAFYRGDANTSLQLNSFGLYVQIFSDKIQTERFLLLQG